MTRRSFQNANGSCMNNQSLEGVGFFSGLIIKSTPFAPSKEGLLGSSSRGALHLVISSLHHGYHAALTFLCYPKNQL